MLNTTILLLVSDAAIRTVISSALESAGYSVLASSGLGSAVDYLKTCRPDLLVVRHYTGSISGHDAAMHLRSICHGLPVLIVGGIMDDDRLENREVLHGFEIFPKPFTAAELLEKVKEVLARTSASK